MAMQRNLKSEFSHSQARDGKVRAPLANVELGSMNRPYELVQTPVNGVVVSTKWTDMSKVNFGSYLNNCLNND